MTTNHPAHGPVSLDRRHQISEILSKAAAQSDGGNLGYAMADAVKVIDVAIAARKVEAIYQVMYGECWRDITEEQYHDHAIHESPIRIVYTAPPAQLVNTIDETLIEALRLVQCMLDDYRERNYGHAQEWIRHISAKMDDYSEQHGDDAYSVISAAMLQAGNSPSKCSLRDGIEAIRNSGIPVDVDKIQSECEAGNHAEQHLDMVDNSGDDNEKVDCRLPFAQWLSQQNEPIDVDCGCVTTEAFYHWLRVAYEAGNSPVIPDGWVPVSERMPDRDVYVQLYCADSREQMVGCMDREESEGYFMFSTWRSGKVIYCKPTHWMPLPAAPKQE